MDLRAEEARAKRQTPRHVQRWTGLDHISAGAATRGDDREDAAFWTHEGVDLDQIQQSLETDWARGQLSARQHDHAAAREESVSVAVEESAAEAARARHRAAARGGTAEGAHPRAVPDVIEWGDGIYGADAAAADVLSKAGERSGFNGVRAACSGDRHPRLFNPRSPHAGCSGGNN